MVVWQVEGLDEVERAFVHVDYEERVEPEHKVDRNLLRGSKNLNQVRRCRPLPRHGHPPCGLLCCMRAPALCGERRLCPGEEQQRRFGSWDARQALWCGWQTMLWQA